MMDLLNCTNLNETHTRCKQIVIESCNIESQNVTVSLPAPDWTVPIVISIVLSSCIMLLLLCNLLIKIFRYRKIKRNIGQRV